MIIRLKHFHDIRVILVSGEFLSAKRAHVPLIFTE